MWQYVLYALVSQIEIILNIAHLHYNLVPIKCATNYKILLILLAISIALKLLRWSTTICSYSTWYLVLNIYFSTHYFKTGWIGYLFYKCPR